MMERIESYFQGKEGHQLFCQAWKTDSPKGTILITHGLSEHSECYERLAKGLEDFGWNIYTWDLKGHGRSEGKRGLILDFMDYCQDLKVFYHLVKEKSPGPIVMLGHSMGGLITLRTLLEFSSLKPHAVCLSAPALGISQPVPMIKHFASKLIASYAPSLTLANDINYENLSQDPEVLKSYEKDTLRHDRVSSGIYWGLLNQAQYCLENSENFNHTLLTQLPENDPVCNTQKAIEFFENVGSNHKQKIIYKNSKHEIYNDIERDQAYSDLRNFIETTLTLD